MWVQLFILSGLIILLIYYRGIDKFTRSIFEQALVIVIAGSLYGLGTFKTINCIFDASPVKSVAVIIKDKFIWKSKGTSYYFRLTEWNSKSGETEERVSRKSFNRKQIGDTVNI